MKTQPRHIIPLALVMVLILSGHDLFLKTDQYYAKPHSRQELFLFNGTFWMSENPISRDRISDPKIIGPEYSFVPTDEHWYDRDSITFLTYTTGGSGTYVAGVSTLPRSIFLEAAEFNEYLEHDGILDVLSAREASGELESDETELYSKHVKAILQVGDEHSDHYSQVLGYPVEFIPVDNPYTAIIGDVITFILLCDGKPLANQLVYCPHDGDHGPEHEHSGEIQLRTDSSGRFSLTIDHPGLYYLRTIHMVKSRETAYSYVSNWATLSFEIRK